MSKIIVALDSSNVEESIATAQQLKAQVDGFKINHLLLEHTSVIKSFADELFIDCKLWDTPNTVKKVIQVTGLFGFLIQKIKTPITKKILNIGASWAIVSVKKYHQGSIP